MSMRIVAPCSRTDRIPIGRPEILVADPVMAVPRGNRERSTRLMKKFVLSVASLAVALVVLALTGAPSTAQSFHKGTFEAGGGFNFPVGESDKYFNDSGSMLI